MKVNASILRPVGVMGLSLFLAWLFAEYYSMSLTPIDAYDLNQRALAKISLLLGIVLGLTVSSLLSDRLSSLRSIGLAALLSFACTVAVSVIATLGAAGISVASPIFFAAWTTSGAGAGLFFALWSVFFSAVDRRKSTVSLAAAWTISSVIFLTIMLADSLPLTLVASLLPAGSVALFLYCIAHSVLLEPVRIAESKERLRLAPLTSVAIAIYGIAFGLAAYLSMFEGFFQSESTMAFASLCTAGLIALACYACNKGHLSFGVVQKIVLPILAAGLIPMPFVGQSGQTFCSSLLLISSVLFSITNYGTLVSYANKYHLAPLYHVSGGRIPIQLGMLIGFLAGFVFLGNNMLSENGLAFVSLGLVFILVLLSSFVPYEKDREKQKGEPKLSLENSLEDRCAAVRRAFGLSQREGEVLVLLAKGRNAQHISNALFISEHTAKTHIHHIYRKVGVNSQQSLIDVVETANPK